MITNDLEKNQTINAERSLVSSRFARRASRFAVAVLATSALALSACNNATSPLAAVATDQDVVIVGAGAGRAICRLRTE